MLLEPDGSYVQSTSFHLANVKGKYDQRTETSVIQSIDQVLQSVCGEDVMALQLK